MTKLLIFALLLVGCTATVVPTPPSESPLPAPTISPSPTTTPTVSPSPSPSPTASPAPTSTPSPTPTPVATPSPTPKPTLVPTPTPTSTSPYTVLKASADSKMIYVASNGVDTNPGTIDLPVKTILKASTLIRNKFPDWILLRRGDIFLETILTDTVGLSFNKSGRSPTEPIVITSYGDLKSPSSLRPEIRTGAKNGIVTYGASNVAVIGLNFHDTLRDPKSPDFVTPVVSAPTGLRLGGNALNWLIEDCVFDSYGQGITLDALGDKLYDFENLSVRYNIVKNSYSNNRSQGLYAGAVHHLLIEGNIFDHNGWTEQTALTKTWNFMAQNHNVYLRQDNTDVLVKDNLILKGADCGVELRPGGTVQNNLFVQNQCNMTIGLVNGAQILKGGVTAEVSGNVILDGRADGNESDCFEIGNTKSVSIHDNICAREVNDPKSYGYALSFEGGNGVSNPLDGLGIQNVTIQNNLFYAWSNGLYMEADLVPGGATYQSFNHLLIQNNAFQGIIRKSVQHEAIVNLANESLLKNTFSTPLGQTAGIFQIGVTNAKGTAVDFSTFVKLLEPDAVYSVIKYSDPSNASVEAYNKSMGGLGTYDSFVSEMELQSAQTFQANRTAASVIAFVRGKFKF